MHGHLGHKANKRHAYVKASSFFPNVARAGVGNDVFTTCKLPFTRKRKRSEAVCCAWYPIHAPCPIRNARTHLIMLYDTARSVLRMCTFTTLQYILRDYEINFYIVYMHVVTREKVKNKMF